MDRMTRCLINLEAYGLKELRPIQKKYADGYEYHFEENQWVTGKMIVKTQDQSQIWSLQCAV